MTEQERDRRFPPTPGLKRAMNRLADGLQSAPSIDRTPPDHTEIVGALMVARKALTGTERKETAIALIDAVTAYLGADGMSHYPDSMLALFAGLLSLVELKYGNADPQVTALINAARRVLGRTPIPAREGAEA